MATTNDAQMPVESFTSTKTFDSQITQPKWGLMRSVNKTGIYCTLPVATPTPTPTVSVSQGRADMWLLHWKKLP
jgi:hypothetical protein